jgi:hypothetical protein
MAKNRPTFSMQDTTKFILIWIFGQKEYHLAILLSPTDKVRFISYFLICEKGPEILD